MSYKRNYYKSQQEKEPEPRLIQLIPLPNQMKVLADYDEDGRIVSYPVYILGLYSDGSTSFIEFDEDGDYENPALPGNFKGYRFV